MSPLIKEELDGHGSLFGYKFTEGGSNGLVTIYIEDDELWHQTNMTFDIAWLPDLMQVAASAATLWAVLRNDEGMRG